MASSNLLIIMSDEHNPLVSGFSGDEFVKTPNLDKLALEGTQFTSAYCNSPICVPSRAAFATGLMPHQSGYWDNAIGYDGNKKSWGHVLQENGVRVESIGKLHYQNAEVNAGFDEQHSPMHIKGSGMLWGLLRDPLPTFDKQAHGMLRPIGAGYSEYNQYDESITAQACNWIKEAGKSNREQPWVLFVGLVAPHFPLTVPKEFVEPYINIDLPEPRLRPEDGYTRHPWLEDMARSQPVDESLSDDERQMAKACYYGLISFMDKQVGEILESLKDSGLESDTRVIYTSDHGDNTGVRGLWGKCTMNDESAGIPLIIRGPDIPSGKKVSTPVSLVDFYPTVLDAVAVEDSNPDGLNRSRSRSLLELAQLNSDEKRIVLSEYHAVGAKSAAYMLRSNRYKYIHYLDYEPELFDMEKDPLETVNIADLKEYSNVVYSFEMTLRELLDPKGIDALAKADQKALIAKHGGPSACSTAGPLSSTPVPTPHEQ